MARRCCGSLILALVMFAPTFAHAQLTPPDGPAETPGQLNALIEQVRARPTDAGRRAAALRTGFRLLATSRYAEALSVFKALLDASPQDEQALYGSALAFFNLKQTERAEQLARAALEAASSRSRSSVNDSSKVEADRRASDALVLLGVISAVKGDNAGALKSVERAVALAPDNFDAQFALGRARFGAGDPHGAARAFRMAVRLKSKDAKARFFLATALEAAGDNEAALNAYRELLTISPESAEGHLGLGALLIKLGGERTDEGVSELTRAISLNGDLYEARITLGRTLLRKGRAQEAVEHLERAAALAPRNPEPHYQLALAYRRLGKTAEAERENAIVKEIHAARRGKDVQGSPGAPSPE